MPDENINPIGTTQTSQNNQATTNQTWNDDFVLNFWDSELKDPENNDKWINDLEIEENNMANSNSDQQDENDVIFDDNVIFEEKEETPQNTEEINIQNLEEEQEEPKNNEYDISLDDESTVDNSENDLNIDLESKDENINNVSILLEKRDEKTEKENEENRIEKEMEENLDYNTDNIDVDWVEEGEGQEGQEEQEEQNDDFSISLEEKPEVQEEKEEKPEVQEEREEDPEIQEEGEENPEVQEEGEEKTEVQKEVKEKTEVQEEGEEDPEVQEEEKLEVQDEILDKEELEVKDNINSNLEINFEDNSEDNENEDIIKFDNLESDANGYIENDPDTELSNNDSVDNINNVEDNLTLEENLNNEDKQEDIFSSSDLFQNDMPENDNNTETKDSLLENDTQQEPKIQDIQTKEQNFNNSESIENSDTTLRDDNLTENATDEQNALENTNSVVDYSLNEKQPIKQPEIWDLLWKSPVDFSKVLSDGIENNQNINLDDNGSIVKNQESDTWNFENLNQWVENLQSNIAENPDFTMDYSESNQEVQSPEFENNGSVPIENPSKNQGDTQNFQISENEDTNQNTSEVNNWTTFVSEENNSLGGQLNNNQNSQMQENVDKINEVIYPQNARELSNRPANNEGTQEITSTLSLDQILDSELNSNPQFTDNSQAVAKNVQKSSWLLANKKMIWIISWILIFLLAWFVFVMAFPSKSFNRKIGDVAINTQDEIEEIHNSWSDDLNDQDLIEEYEVSDTESEKQLDETTDTTLEEGNKTAWSSVQVFPDAEIDEWDEILDENTPTDIEPYICIGNDCEKESNITSNTMTIEEKKSVISDFKSYAQEYYNLWDETQDKKLVRYAAQIMYLCDNYQEQLENWEWNNQESFENFESKVSSLKDKMIKYFGSINDIGNLNWDSKADYEEVKNYINARANEMN